MDLGRQGMDMTDYRRMVSYMYQYENGVKKKNVGFARIEAKDGQCKITLHMQLLGQLDSIFPTYLIQRGINDMELIYLGDSVLKNQVMDSKLSAKEGNIMNSGYSLSELGGLLLFLNDTIFFATEWDDKPLVLNEVLEAMKPKEKKEPEMILEQKPELTLEQELLIPKYKLPRGYKIIERMQVPQRAAQETASDLTIAGSEVEEYKEENGSKVAEIDNITEKEEIDSEAFRVLYHEAEEDKAGMWETQSMNLQEEKDPVVAKEIFDHNPRVYPFEDNEILVCAKIEPKDIGLLPKELWALSNNSFLMHGYYCYHHLIFAKLKDRYGCRFILGVPGIYHNRERFMAKMFGFDNFKPIRKRELRQGDFGYWYLPISL